LLELETQDPVLGHPVVGASWEGFATDNLIGGRDDHRNQTLNGTHIVPRNQSCASCLEAAATSAKLERERVAAPPVRR